MKALLHRFAERTRVLWLRCVILIVIGFAVRFPALSGELVWDDTSLIRDNPFIKSPLLWFESFRHYLALDGSSTHYRPVQNISYFFDYLIWNADPFGYHLSNVFWHVGGGLLLYFLLRRLLAPFRNRFASNALSDTAFLLALLWIVHPVHSAAVDYISGRADCLAFFFACAAWLVYLKARSSESHARRFGLNAAAIVLALASLCSRETSCVWMLLFLFHAFVFDRETPWRAKAKVGAVCFTLIAGYAGLRQLPVEHLLSSGGSALPFAERAGLMLRALGDYARLMVFPSNLHLERSVRWSAENSNVLLSVLGLVAAVALVYGAFRKGKAQPIRIFGAAWFVLGYLPISNLFPLNATVAEHWLYLPSVGLLIFIAGFCLELPARRYVIPAAIGVIAVTALSARSFMRSGDWINSETLYRHSLAAGAAQSRFVLNLAQTYAAQKNYAKAEALLRNLVTTSPNYAMAQNALGHLLLEEGKTSEAEKVFADTARQITPAATDQPRTWIASLNLAYLKYSEHETAAALAILETARADYPGTWRLIGFESEILRGTGESQKALALVEEFRRTNWWHCAAAIEAGRIHSELRQFDQAEADLRRASWLDIHDAESLNLIAAINLEQNRLDTACDAQRHALRRQPDEPRQYFLLADILQRMGRDDDARAALAQVRELQDLAKAR
jgi:tetratricopeptide (TPR) repeat protein